MRPFSQNSRWPQAAPQFGALDASCHSPRAKERAREKEKVSADVRKGSATRPDWRPRFPSMQPSSHLLSAVRLPAACPPVTCPVLATLLLNSNLRVKPNFPGRRCHPSPSAGRTRHTGSSGSTDRSSPSGDRGPALTMAWLPSWPHSTGWRCSQRRAASPPRLPGLPSGTHSRPDCRKEPAPPPPALLIGQPTWRP